MRGRLQPFLLALLAGLAQAAAMSLPGSGDPAWWLQLASLAVLAGLLRTSAGWRQAALLGWTFSTAWLTGTFWWLYISMHVYGGLASPLAALAVLGLSAFLGSYYAVASALARSFVGAGTLRWTLGFSGAWLLAELMRGRWFTGFPWGAGGYAHVEGPLAGLAPLVGVYGVGFAASCIAAGVAVAWHRRSRRAIVAAAGVALVAGVAAWTGPGTTEGAGSTGTISVALLQGNIPQDEKFEPGSGVPLALDWYARQLQGTTASLVVAPETAIPLLPQQLPEGYLAALGRHVDGARQAALVGIPLGSHDAGYTNSVIGLKGGAPVYRYDKHHLVPFGEFIPPLFRWFTDLMNIPLGDFNRGFVGQPSFEWQGQRLAPNVCYEDLFGEELAARFRQPGLAPTVFVNVSNIAWFGNTVAIDQHLHISRMRALEFQRPMVRATNTGATVVIDHTGRVTHALERHTRGVLLAQAQGRTGLTPFARWAAAFGLWPCWVLGLALVGVALPAIRREPARAPAA